MNYAEVIDVVMRENAMLKNSLNIYADMANKATAQSAGLCIAFDRTNRELSNMIEQLNIYRARTERRLLVMEKAISARLIAKPKKSLAKPKKK